MRDNWYKDYAFGTVDCDGTRGVTQETADRFYASLGVLKMFDRLGFAKVQFAIGGREHNWISIYVDGKRYSEHVTEWNKRFE